KDARKWLGSGEVIKEIETYEKFLMMGFSASAQFTNRFMTIHPEHVKAAIFGSPGGWPMVPHKTYQNKTLRYPVGIADFEEVTGKKFNHEEYKKVPVFYFLGDKDENDAVIFRDAF